MFGRRLTTRARLGVLAGLVASIVVIAPQQGGASEAGPNGVNVGFDFSWERTKAPGGYTASFLNTDSVSLNNCGGSNFTLTSTGCNFVFNYKVAGITQPSVSHSANWITWTKPTTYTLGSPSTTGCNSGAASTTAGGKAPVTLFDCFNVHSFGQVFAPTSTGRLSAMQFRMTCLVPWGANSLNLYALLYRLTDDASSLAGSGPIAAAKLDLSTCPSALSWDGKTFSDADFGWVEMPFKNVRVSANTLYGVYFAGNGVPGTPPIGAEAAIAATKAPAPATTAAPAPKPGASTTTTSTTVPPTTTTVAKKKTPKTTTTTTTVPPTTTTVKKRTPKSTTTSTTVPPTTTTVAKKKTPKTTTTTTTVPPTTTTTVAIAGDTYTALPGSVKAENALRVVTPAEVDKTVLVSGTGSVCLPAGPFLVFMKPGFCKAYVVSRQTKGNLRVLTTRVLKSTAARGEEGLPIEILEPLYFEGGTAKLKSASEKLVTQHAQLAKSARAVLIVGYTGNLTFNKEAQTDLARRRAAVTMVELQAAGVKGPFSLHMGGADNAVSNGTSVAEQDKNRRTIIILVR
jgi:outer membrane protein OmpA-like peptidoglycan-associated protein